MRSFGKVFRLLGIGGIICILLETDVLCIQFFLNWNKNIVRINPKERALKPATHLVILYADRGEFDRKRFSPPIDADTLGDFFRRSRRCGSFENSCDKIAQPDGLALLAIRSNDRRKSRERAHLANAGEFNRRYLTCQISAILYDDRRKSQSLHRAHLAIFADRGDRRIKSPSVSLALDY